MPEVITNNLDLLTSALRTKSAVGRGSNGKLEAYGIKKLRELILELAVRGKLVPHDPTDEPAGVLLEKIAEEKKRLVKEGKINKQEPLPEIREDEKPFELCKGWEWVRLGSTGIGRTGTTPSTSNPKYYDGTIPFVGPGQITLEGNIIYSDKTLTEEGSEYGVIAKAADILMVCIGGSIGKSAIVRTKVAFNQQINCISPLYIDSTYLNAAMNSPHFQTSILEVATGSATPIINRSKWEALLVAIPPIAEQHRIVAKVNELMALCDQLEQQQIHSIEAHQVLVEIALSTLTHVETQQELTEAWNRIANHFDTLFTTEMSIDQLKQTILQLAVMGKLVPQEPNDEPACDSLKKVSTEKAKLVKEGTIKKQKLSPPIKPEEMPYELPQSWVWARLQDITFFQEGPGIMAKDFRDTGIPLIRIAGMHNDMVSLEGCNFLDEDMVKKKWNHFKLELGDVVLSSSASLGKVAKVGDETVGCIVYTGLIRFQPYACLYVGYLITFLNSNEFLSQINESKTGAAIMHYGPTHLKSMFVPLAPLAEQHRIVVKVNELMALCDALTASLADAQAIQTYLADAIVEQAVA